ncbi:MAG: site-2 protease family protein, partial [Cyanobacteria bacterium J06636_27]
MSVLAAIAVLAVLIFVHELGHFIAARSQGI